MLTRRVFLIPTLILFGQILFACSSPAANGPATNSNLSSNANRAEQTNSAKDNIDELGMLVALPFEPEDVVYKERDKKLTAVLVFTDENAAKLTSHLARLRPPTPDTLAAEAWYPTELVSQSEMSSDSTIKGQTYAADDFYRPPYTAGKITRVENSNLFVLQLTAS